MITLKTAVGFVLRDGNNGNLCILTRRKHPFKSPLLGGLLSQIKLPLANYVFCGELQNSTIRIYLLNYKFLNVSVTHSPAPKPSSQR